MKRHRQMKSVRWPYPLPPLTSCGSCHSQIMYASDRDEPDESRRPKVSLASHRYFQFFYEIQHIMTLFQLVLLKSNSLPLDSIVNNCRHARLDWQPENNSPTSSIDR